MAEVRLKPAHGFANSGRISLESWLLGQGITATGSVRNLRWQQQAQPSWRERWLQLARSTVTDLSQGPLLLAMVFGEQVRKPGELGATARIRDHPPDCHLGDAYQPGGGHGAGLGRLLLLLPWLKASG